VNKCQKGESALVTSHNGVDHIPGDGFFFGEHMVEVSCKHIGFDVDSGARFVGTKECVFEGVGDDGESKGVFENVVYGQADAIYCDASFWDDVFDVFFWDFDVDVGGIAEWDDFGYFPDGVDVSLYDVSF